MGLQSQPVTHLWYSCWCSSCAVGCHCSKGMQSPSVPLGRFTGSVLQSCSLDCKCCLELFHPWCRTGEFQEFPISLFLQHLRDPCFGTETSQGWWSPWTWICLVLMTHKRTVALFQWMFTFLIRSQIFKSGNPCLCAKCTWNSRKFNAKIPGRHIFLLLQRIFCFIYLTKWYCWSLYWFFVLTLRNEFRYPEVQSST